MIEKEGLIHWVIWIFLKRLQTSIKQHEYIQELLDDILLSLIKERFVLKSIIQDLDLLAIIHCQIFLF